MAAILAIDHLAKAYSGKSALKDLSLSVDRGQVFGLLGPNGSGKTTTLGIVLGALRADRGHYVWFGEGSGGRQRRRIGALLEQPSFYPWLTGRQNLAVFAAIKGVSAGEVDQPLKTVGLYEARDKAFEAYSLGMKQRLGIAAALLGKPEVLVLDEPTNGVDAQGIFEIRSLIGSLAAQGITVILASHMLDEVEKVCTHLAILKDGGIVKAGAIATVLSNKSWIEVGAADLGVLERALRELEPAARVVIGTSTLELHGGVLAAGDLNARLLQRGIVLEHLARRHPSLESNYLALVGTEAAT